jgi:hypothetical protein
LFPPVCFCYALKASFGFNGSCLNDDLNFIPVL